MLLNETGKFLVQHVWERARAVRTVDEVVIATDAQGILDAASSFGARAVLTSPDHRSGSDRAAEIARSVSARLVVNVQGDEPELEPGDVEALIAAMQPNDPMGTLVYDGLTDAQQDDPDVVKARVVDGYAVDFTRERLPGGQRHLGVYAFSAEFLQEFTRLEPTKNEGVRRLEQMRALDHGYRIRAVPATHEGLGIDTAADYAAFVRRCRGGAAPKA